VEKEWTFDEAWTQGPRNRRTVARLRANAEAALQEAGFFASV